jgi:hypothetical protein
MRNAGLIIICTGILCITLALGLWPFHAPRNDVAWLADHGGLRFGRYSTVFSAGAFHNASPNNAGNSIDIWLQPALLWNSNTFLAFYNSKNPAHFSLHQSQTELRLQTFDQADQYRPRTASLSVADVFSNPARYSPIPRPVFITITSGERGTVVYLDGIVIEKTSQFRLSEKSFTGHLVIGDSPGQSDSWSGQLLGLALYHRELTEPQVFRNFTTWKQSGRPEITEDARNVALYLFDEHKGNVVRDKTGAGVDLYIPDKYIVQDQIFMEPIWKEFGMTRSYLDAAVKNIVGLIPFGFCFYAYLSTVLSIKRAKLVTVALGTAVSLTIEILQAYLPTRDSGTTDLLTNTLSAWIGVASYDLLAPTLLRFFPWLPFPAPQRSEIPVLAGPRV